MVLAYGSWLGWIIIIDYYCLYNWVPEKPLNKAGSEICGKNWWDEMRCYKN